ncbi:MAG: cytochrome c-type biogenesis protein CcmE [bacterium]|jgi:cytochrome c-type biogenesis protein CcmE
MKNSQRTKILIGSLIIISIATVLLASISSDSLTYYQTPEIILKHPKRFMKKNVRVMGLVEIGSVKWNAKTTSLSFRILQPLDTKKNYLNIVYKGSKPDMFKEGQGVVVDGVMLNQTVFKASELLVKHTEEYKATKHSKDKSKYYQSMTATN